ERVDQYVMTLARNQMADGHDERLPRIDAELRSRRIAIARMKQSSVDRVVNHAHAFLGDAEASCQFLERMTHADAAGRCAHRVDQLRPDAGAARELVFEAADRDERGDAQSASDAQARGPFRIAEV